VNARDAVPMTPSRRAHIERVKEAVLKGRMLPEKPVALDGWLAVPRGVERLAAQFCITGSLCFLDLANGKPLGAWGLLIAVIVSIPMGDFCQSRLDRWRRSHVRRLLDPHRGFVCPACGYALSTRPDVGICPECGTLYTRREIVRLWTAAYKLKHDWSES